MIECIVAQFLLRHGADYQLSLHLDIYFFNSLVMTHSLGCVVRTAGNRKGETRNKMSR